MEFKITNKNGATLKTANKYVKEDIAITIDESFVQPSGTLEVTENGTHDVTNYESVNVNVPTSGGESAEGTAVPNSGYVEKVYFNTALSNEETVNILSKLTYVQTPLFDHPLCGILFANDGNPIIIAGTIGEGDDIGYYISIITDMNNEEFVNAFDYNNGSHEEGWKLNEYTIDKEVISEYEGLPIGTQNELIKNLISTTPFSSGSCEPTGLPLEVSELPTLGTVVPTSGMIEKVYVNTSLSVEEVVNILETLTFVPYQGDTYIWACVTDDTMANGLAVTRFQSENSFIYYIVSTINNEMTTLFTYENLSSDGWSSDFNGVVEFNIENQLELIAPNLGFTPENEKAKNLFSITPIDVVVDGAIYAVPSSVTNDTVVPNTGYVGNVYFNTSLSTKEIVDIIINNISDSDFIFEAVEEWYYYPIAISNDLAKLLLIVKDTDSTGSTIYGIGFKNRSEQVTLFISTDGWLYENDFIFYDANVINDLFGTPIGNLNSALSNLVSIAPFNKDYYLCKNSSFTQLIPEDELQGEPLVVDKLPISYQGTAVPTSGMVEKVYFNTKLSKEEVVNLVTKYYPLAGENALSQKNILISKDSIDGFLRGIDIISLPDGFAIQSNIKEGNQSETIFNTSLLYGKAFGMSSDGWLEFDNPVIVGFEISETHANTSESVGVFNNELSMLFSTTPFVSVINSNINPNSIYLLKKDGVEMWGREGDQLINVGEIFASQGATFDVYFVDKQPSLEDMIPTIETAETVSLHLYWVESENEGYMNMNGEIVKYSETLGTDFPVLGVVTSKDDIIEETGIYIYKYNVNDYYKYDDAKDEFVKFIPESEIETESGTSAKPEQEKSVTPTTSVQEVTPDDGYTLSKVTVDAIPSEYIIPTGTLEITEKGEYDVKNIEKVNVNIESGSENDMLQLTINGTNSCRYLFYRYKGTNVDFIANLDTSNVTNMQNMFCECSKLTTIPQLDTSKVTDMSYMFFACNALTSVPQLDTSNVTDTVNMFSGCSKLTSISQINTSKVTKMTGMFRDCSKITSIPQLNTSNVTAMNSMFYNCYSLTSVPQLDTSKVTDMGYMFNGCYELTSVPQLDTSKVTRIDNIFNNCSKLTSVPQLDTSKITNMRNMFSGCEALTTIPQLDTSKVTDMSYMFYGCLNLLSLPQLDTSNINNMVCMFYGCTNIKIIDMSKYNCTSSTYSSDVFYNCSSLKALVIREFGSYVLNSNAFSSSGIANGTGYIYVPRSMVDTLSQSTNWSTYASRIRALEDYTVDGTVNGNLDYNKIWKDNWVDPI